VPAGTHRSHLFLAQRLLLLVEAASLVPDMHAAYARLASAPLPPYGVFIAGPSKTADIEQTLVLGAHGPCELTVLLVG
jgi:L-lactate dehydrogenase complex protein LldG